MYFNDEILNQQYANQVSNNQITQYQMQQNNEMAKMVKAMYDMYESIKKMDERHQQEAFLACLGVMAQAFGQ